MKTYSLIGVGFLVLGIWLYTESRKRKSQQVINGIVFRPTAIFIWQSASKDIKN